MGVDMLLLDSEATMMPATINVNRLATHQTSLKAGSVYSLTGFDVARCNPNYRLSDSSLLIRFSDTTSFVEVTKPAVPIPLESFRFRNHSEMLGLSNTNNQLSDLIGEITAVKSTVTDPLQDKNRVMATIKMYNGTLVTMSLFDTHAVAIYNRLEKMGSDPRVVVATSINPKMLGGRLFLNATSGTHIYFDKETAAGESFFNRLFGEATGVTPAAPLLRGYAKVDALTIAELNNFVITAPSHAGEGVNPEETEAPQFVRNMEGKTYKFQVRVSSYNFTANHQTFTISRILSEGGHFPYPEFVDNGGDDDNGDDNPLSNSVPVKLGAGGTSKVDGAAGKLKKARKA